MSFKDGAILGAFTGALLWGIFRLFDYFGHYKTLVSIYPMQTFFLMMLIIAVFMGLMLIGSKNDVKDGRSEK